MLSVLLAALIGTAAASDAVTPSDRTYALSLASRYDLDTLATAGPTLHRMGMDAYGYGLRPRLSPGLDSFLGTVWSVAWTYTTVLWPHEFGHWSRAEQLDSKFIFHNLNPILPHTTVEMPDSATFADSALLSVGGFEVNAMVARQAELDFYADGGAWSDELGHALVNEMFFPIYAGIFPAKAQEAETWIKTRGDPVHVVLPVFQRHTGRDPIQANGEVDPELVRLYRESVALSLLWSAIDPGTVQRGIAFMEGPFDHREAWMPVDGERLGWTWGTQFQPTPLGYALALSQYLFVADRMFVVGAHYGRPMMNNGLRLAAPDLLRTSRLGVGFVLDGWGQDEYGLGLSAESSLSATLSEHLRLTAAAGYKTEGYLLGRRIEAGPHVRAGLEYRFAHTEPQRAGR